MMALIVVFGSSLVKNKTNKKRLSWTTSDKNETNTNYEPLFINMEYWEALNTPRKKQQLRNQTLMATPVLDYTICQLIVINIKT